MNALTRTVLPLVGAFVALSLTPAPSSACGIKSIGMESTVSYTGSQGVADVGQMAIYGKTRVDRRLALAIQSAGHRVYRAKRPSAARTADVVLTSAALAPQVERALSGTNAMLVIVLAPGESAPSSARYVVRERDRLYVQMAMVDQALRAARGDV